MCVPLATSTLLTFMSLLPSLSLIRLGSQPPPAPTGHRYWTTKRDGEVRLRQDDSFPYETPLTVHDMVMGTATKYANYIALGSKHRHGWHLLTYIELYEECRRAAKAFLQVPARLRAAPPPPARPAAPADFPRGSLGSRVRIPASPPRGMLVQITQPHSSKYTRETRAAFCWKVT